MQFMKQYSAGFVVGIAVAICIWSVWIVYSVSSQTRQNTIVIAQIVELINKSNQASAK